MVAKTKCPGGTEAGSATLRCVATASSEAASARTTIGGVAESAAAPAAASTYADIVSLNSGVYVYNLT